MKSIWELGMDDIISPAIQRIQANVRETFAKINTMESSLHKGVQHTTEGLHEQQSMLGSLREAAVEFFAVEKFMEMGSEILKGGMAMETAKANMQTFAGSITEGNEAFEKLIEFHERFPIVNKQSTLEAGQNLMQVGVHADALQGVLYHLGAVAHGSGEQMVSLSQMYSRAVASGYVNSRMLINQPALLQIIEHQVGKSGVAFKKYAATGQISLDMLNKALEQSTEAGGRFHKGLENAQNTMAGHVAEIHSRMEATGQKIYKALAPAILKMLDFAQVILPKVEHALRAVWHAGKDLSAWVQEHIGLLSTLTGAVAGVTVSIGLFNVATFLTTGLFEGLTLAEKVLMGWYMIQEAVMGNLIIQQWLLNAAMSANVIGIVIIAIGALVGVFVYLESTIGSVKETFNALWDECKNIFHNIGDLFTTIFAPIFKTIELIKSGHFAEAAKEAGKALFNISPAGMVYQTAKWGANGGATHNVGNAIKAAQAKHAGASPGKKNTDTETLSDKITTSLAGNSPSGSADAAGGGASGKNITIHIAQLGPKEVSIHVAKAIDGVHEMGNQLRKTLIAVVNDAETAM